MTIFNSFGLGGPSAGVTLAADAATATSVAKERRTEQQGS